MQGPNVKRLIAHRASAICIPSGGGLADGIRAIATPGKLTEALRQATKEIDLSIAAVRAAPDNQFGDDEEAIAGEILRQIEEAKRKRWMRPSQTEASR